jgi:imidazolonepropionase-like amidohydrolase
MLEGRMTLSPEQLIAACDEAKKQGLRTLVHAYRDAVRAATLGGCTEIEHGLGATDDDLKLMAEKGTYFDPQAGLLLETYLLNKSKYAGTPFYPADDFVGQPILDNATCFFVEPRPRRPFQLATIVLRVPGALMEAESPVRPCARDRFWHR